MPRIGLGLGLTLLLALAASLAGAVFAAVTVWPLPALVAASNEALGRHDAPPQGLAAIGLTAAVSLPLLALLAQRAAAPLQRLLRALQSAVLSYRDGDFSVSIGGHASGEFGTLLRLHQELGHALRDQRRQLAQRELLLDTVVQHTPVALLLADATGHVVYANLAARRLLAQGRRLAGTALAAVLAARSDELERALRSGEDQLLSLPGAGGAEEQWHWQQRTLTLHGAPHRLVLLRPMTRELAREEVASWKRVIRVVSHELNNSLAPISSLAHSGAELARRGEIERLAAVFERIGERAAHLHGFLAGYADFAKLPQPRTAAVDWPAFVARVAAHAQLRLEGTLPKRAGWFDTGQVEQALINLLRNAHEAGGAGDAVTLQIALADGEQRLTVADRGPGMSDAVMAQALLPFYSTKREGTGLGLALAREIAEAHGGRIVLARRDGGGLAATLVLPIAPRGAGAP